MKKVWELFICSVFFTISAIVFYSCNNGNKDPKYDQFMSVCEGEIHFVFVPMCYDVIDTLDFVIQKTDSFICCYDNSSLYNMLNFKFVDSTVFLETIYKKTISNDYIDIDKSTYLCLDNDRVTEIPEITQLYNEKGIEAVLETFDPEDSFYNHYTEFKYIAYLCWQNNIFISSEDESKKIFINSKMESN